MSYRDGILVHNPGYAPIVVGPFRTPARAWKRAEVLTNAGYTCTVLTVVDGSASRHDVAALIGTPEKRTGGAEAPPVAEATPSSTAPGKGTR
jgi:hypothetical protein